MKITFVTSNIKKFEEVKRWMNQLDSTIEVEQAPIELPEYQSLDIHEIGLGKALEAWRIVQKPLFIDDGGIFLEKYPLFPGAFSKHMVEALGLEAIWSLVQDNPIAYMKNCLVYIDSAENQQFFDGECKGKLIKPSHAIKETKMPYTEIFIPDGADKTFAMLRGTEEEKKYHHRLKSMKKMVEWLRTKKK